MSELHFEKLKENIIYVLKEAQIKLGYTDNAASLNYPPASLCRLLGRDLGAAELRKVMEDFCSEVRPLLGEIKISDYDGQYCLTIPPDGVRYVHENIADSGFLTDLIALLREHRAVDIDDVLAVFYRYSDKVACRKVDDDEYNYVIYFEDGTPDDFIYLVEIDLGHASYHRMTRADYEAEIKDTEY